MGPGPLNIGLVVPETNRINIASKVDEGGFREGRFWHNNLMLE
jgi:hypothetical protein